MTVSNPAKHVQSRSTLSAPTTLRLAWLCWSVLLVIPFSVALWFAWQSPADPQALSRTRDAWQHACARTPHGAPIELRPDDFVA